MSLDNVFIASLMIISIVYINWCFYNMSKKKDVSAQAVGTVGCLFILCNVAGIISLILTLISIFFKIKAFIS